MKATLFGTKQKEVEEMVKNLGFVLVKKDPHIVICYGGDGTLFGAEYEYPGIPKVMVRGSRVCKLCNSLSNEEVLKRIKKEKYKKEKIGKLEVSANGKTLIAMNDVVVHNKDPRHAMRYTIHVDGVQVGEEIIGDGVVVATPLGSSGYYRSITDSSFEVGIGLAFNNSTEQSDHIVLSDERSIVINVTRGPAIIYADNQKESIEVNVGDEVAIVKSEQFATILKV
ncbi:MAG: hypothetical protein WCW78_01990 [Candidatus Paceibacterota bacterium]|jgi:NAD+ kinase